MLSVRLIALVLVSVVSCGGGAPEPASPSAEKVASGEASGEPRKPGGAGRGPRVACADGSCFACGETTCLSGFYCSVGRRSRGCAWHPACGSKPSCACLTTQLRDAPSCACEEKDGGVYVVCDGASL